MISFQAVAAGDEGIYSFKTEYDGEAEVESFFVKNVAFPRKAAYNRENNIPTTEEIRGAYHAEQRQAESDHAVRFL